MSLSSPRRNRGLPAQAGASVILALALAAILGGIALGIDALKSGQVNTSALSAQAAQPAQASKQECLAGWWYQVSEAAGSPVVDKKNLLHCEDPANKASSRAFGSLVISCNPPRGIEVVYSQAGPVSSKLCDPDNPTNGSGAPPSLPSGGSGTGGSGGTPTVTPDTNFDVCNSSSSSYSATQCAQQQAMSSSGAQGNPGTSNDVCDPSSTSYSATQCAQQQAMSSPGAQGNPGTSNDVCDSASASYNATQCAQQQAMSSPGAQANPCAPNQVSVNGQCMDKATAADACSSGDAAACAAAGVSCASGQVPLNGTCVPTQTIPLPQAKPCVDQSGNSTACPPGASPGAKVCNNGGTDFPTCTAPPPSCTGPSCNQGSGQRDNTFNPSANNGSGSNPLSSILSGLARGLASGLAGGVGSGQTCSPQQQQQYQAQLQQYQYQQQQYQNQAQYNSYYNLPPPPPPVSTAPCSSNGQNAPYGTGTNGSACQAPPSQPAASQCTVGTWQPTSSSGNGCTTGYQCVPSGNGSQPSAQLSCQPQIADVGQSVAISYSCTNATGSQGSGFSTNNQPSGSASTTIQAPPVGTNTATYSLACTNGTQTASAQCSVQIGAASIILVANPKNVATGQTTTIGWVTSGMQACVVSSPDDANFTAANASNTDTNGVAQTDAILHSSEYDLTCTTVGGTTKHASAIVSVGSATSTAAGVTLSSNVDGGTANHGGTVTVTWKDQGAAANSAMSLWLIDVQTEATVGLIAGAQPTSGTYQWTIPAAGSTCDTSSAAPCESDLVAGDSYGIEAALYTPANANLTSNSGTAPSYLDYGYTPTPFTVGQ